ncbi:MAG: DUF2442 domain-containing protein [Ignavibacteria bacterium]|nr:DUF2442 domain-containing protein [Ignavibacteria bacterium]
MISKPQEVSALDNYKIWIKFEDGVKGEIDLSALKGKGVFEIWNDYKNFTNVYIDKETFAVAWNREVEIDTNNLYLRLTGKTYEQWKDENIEYASDK